MYRLKVWTKIGTEVLRNFLNLKLCKSSEQSFTVIWNIETKSDFVPGTFLSQVLCGIYITMKRTM